MSLTATACMTNEHSPPPAHAVACPRIKPKLIPASPSQEERNRKAIQRSLQAPRKKAGRPVMFRSRLQKRKVSKNKELSHGEDLDEIKHLT